MNGRLPAICIFFTLLSCVLCQSSVLIGTSSTYFVFSTEFFQQFHECLCGSGSGNCYAYVGNGNLDFFSRVHYYVTNITTYNTSRPDQYSGRYECSLFGDRSSGTVYWISCERQRNSDIKGPPASSLLCQSLRVSCSGRCVDVLWSTNHSFWLRGEDIRLVSCGSCELETSTGPTTTTTTTARTTTTASPTSAATSTTTKATPTSTFDKQKGDDPNDDNIPLMAGVVVTVIVVLAIAGVIIIIWWRRKRNLKPPSTSHHYTTSTGAISHNYENTGHRQEHVNENGRSATNPYVIDDSDSIQATSPQQQAGQTVVDSYVSQEEVIQKKRAAAAKNSNTGNQGTEYSSIDQDVPDAVISPVNEPQNNNTRSAPNPSSVTPASTTYSRLGEPVRNIHNPYNALQNPDEYSVAISTPANSNTSTQYSLAGPTASLSSIHDTDISYNSTPPSQPTNRNAYGYEEVGVNNMSTHVVSNNNEESPIHASGDNKDGAEAPKEPDYTNFPVKEPVAAKNDYAKLGEPVRNIQNPYDVMVNQKEDRPEESTSQAPPNSADDPYSLARPTLR